MTTRAAAVLAALLALALASAGCEGPPKEPNPGQVKAVFEDVPAPEGLDYDEGYGHVAPSGKIRTYTQKYSGSRKLQDVADFYEKALPVHGWKKVSGEGKDPVKLVFQKDPETCTVELTSTGHKVVATVRLDAKK